MPSLSDVQTHNKKSPVPCATNIMGGHPGRYCQGDDRVDSAGLRVAEDSGVPCSMQQARVEAEAVLFDCTQHLLQKLHLRPDQARIHRPFISPYCTLQRLIAPLD